MAKRVILLSGRQFKPVTSAKAYFSGLRERTPLKSLLAEPERSDVIDIYQRYCRATGHTAEVAAEVTVVMDEKQRPGGNYAQAVKAFAVLTPTGALVLFSMDKALKAVAE